MALTLFELAGDQGRRFSPFSWRTLMALRHKGLDAERVAVKFTDKDVIAFSGQDRVPVLGDGDTTVSDSWAIADYLEQTHPQTPSLFGGTVGRGGAKFINAWTDLQLHPHISRLIVRDVYDSVHPDDKAHFKETREARYGASFDSLHETRDQHLGAMREVLAPVRVALEDQPFLCGESAAYADYIVFGAFQWARCASPYALLEGHDPVHAWRERMLDVFDGFARAAPGYPV